MMLAIRENLTVFSRFLRTRSLSRSIVGLLSLAIVLLLAVNLGTFVMIRRTADFNDTVAQVQAARRASRTVLLTVLDAETGQRGFIVTARPEFMRPYTEARARLPEVLETLQDAAADDPDIAARAARIESLANAKVDELEQTIGLARTGRAGEAIQMIRGERGKILMDQLRDEVAAVDEIQETRLAFARRRSEWASGATVVVNALAGVLILMLAGISLWLIRRYIGEIQQARDQVARLNEGLEDKVRERTGALSRANEEIQRFAYIVSHDLRAPLVNVMGYTSELEQAGRVIDRQLTIVETKAPKLAESDAITAAREDIPEAIGFIRASTEKMDRLINAILKLSREGRRTLVPEVLDMTKMVQAIADSVRHQTQAADAEIVVERLPVLDSDRLSIEQVFGNLVDNAVKYLEPSRQGRIVVSGVETPDGSEFRVTDNGRGVAPRDHERIFELFRRSGRQDRTGEGLGLAFVRNSVRRIGGEIRVESELDQGSTFILTFPKHLTVIEAGDAA
ncbi:MAG: CHASE3 domain-containing protein [Pseudomonadota bacterium]